MNRNNTDYLHLRESPLLTMLESVTTNYMFVNIATIKEIHNDNYIDAALYWTDNMENEIVIPDVRLLQLGTTKCKIFIQPVVGDNVLLVCPRDFVEKLEFNRKAKNIDFSNMAYSSKNMCAILIKDESDDNVKTTVNIDENGNITVKTDGDATVNAKKDCSVTAENILVKANTKTEIKGAKVIIGGTVTPNGTGALCGMPYCAFSGAPQTGDTSNNA